MSEILKNPEKNAITKKPVVDKIFTTEENIKKRKSIRLNNINASTVSKRIDLNGPVIWYDSINLKYDKPSDDVFTRIINMNYSGIVLYLTESLNEFIQAIPPRMKIILKLKNQTELKEFCNSNNAELFKNNKTGQFILSYDKVDVLERLTDQGYITCYNCYVNDKNSLHSAINDGLKFNYLSILFKDPTNIPLELVIASLQKTNTILLKEITDPEDVDDAIVCLGVMEYGSEGVIFSPNNHEVIDNFNSQLTNRSKDNLQLQVGTITSTRSIGMGYRSCIDTATLFDDDEGMIVGSTSQGGFLCCPEVYFLPYMELRPFRVNAGAVHSYVFNTNDRTDYMSELTAGASVMLVNSKGRIRSVPVGRMKTEQRPLRLIEATFPNGKEINVIMQDDWHVRIFSDKSKPLNISELKLGDKVLGYTTETGRHVGIKIDENILEK